MNTCSLGEWPAEGSFVCGNGNYKRITKIQLHQTEDGTTRVKVFYSDGSYQWGEVVDVKPSETGIIPYPFENGICSIPVKWECKNDQPNDTM